MTHSWLNSHPRVNNCGEPILAGIPLREAIVVQLTLQAIYTSVELLNQLPAWQHPGRFKPHSTGQWMRSWQNSTHQDSGYGVPIMAVMKQEPSHGRNSAHAVAIQTATWFVRAELILRIIYQHLVHLNPFMEGTGMPSWSNSPVPDKGYGLHIMEGLA